MIYGRDRERAQLRELLDDVEDGHGSLVLIGGEAGIGKTTIIDDLVEEAHDRECLVLSGGCYDLTTTPPYGPWTEVLNRYRPGEDDPNLPPWFHNPEEFEQVGSQQALFEETARFFRAVAGQQPVLVVLEDLHWSDPATLEALRYLARGLADDAVLLVASYRDDELTRRHELYQLMPVLIRESRAERIYLNRLDQDAATRLVRDRYDLPEEDIQRLTSYIQERSEGNPFFAEELLRGLEDAGTLKRLDGGTELGELTEMLVPPMLRQVIEGRLQRLDQRTLELLEIAAVIGHEASLDLWQEVSGAETSELNTAMVTALDANVINESSDGSNLVFHHALMREALYTGMTPLQRREFHRAVVDQLIEEPGADPDEIVTHLEHSFDPRALDWLTRAGDRAMRSFAWEVAAERYERALELLERRPDPDPVRHCQILLALGEAHNLLAAGRLGTGSRPGLGGGGSYVGRDTFMRAAEVARKGGTPEQLAHAALGVVGHNPSPQQGGIKGVYLLEEALERLPEEDSPLRVQLLARFGLDAYLQAVGPENLQFTPDLQAEVLARTEAAVLMARRLDDPAALTYALTKRIIQQDLLSEEEWLTLVSEAVDAATVAGDRVLLDQALTAKSQALARRGEIAALRELLNQYVSVADELRLPVSLWRNACQKASLALSDGRLQHAEEYVDEANRIQPQSGWGTALRIAVGIEKGWTTELDDELENLRGPMIQILPLWRPLRLLVDMKMGDPELVRGEFHAFMDDAIAAGRIGQHRFLWLRSTAWMAEICAVLDDSSYADRLYAALVPNALQNVNAVSTEGGGCVSYYLGLLATTMELWDEAEEHFGVAFEKNSEWGYRLHVANTQYAWGEMLLRRGLDEDRQRALELLEQARALADEIGSVRLLRLIDDLLPQQAAPRTAYPAGLTQREVEVLRLVADGMTDAETAEELFISPRTVGQHLRSVYRKLGVNNRLEAAVRAIDLDIA